MIAKLESQYQYNFMIFDTNFNTTAKTNMLLNMLFSCILLLYTIIASLETY